MYRVAVCEDEDMLRRELGDQCGEILAHLEVEHQVLLYASAEELEEALSGGERFDLLCLDILLTGKSGMDLALELRGWDERTSILFITSSTEFLLEGYGARPIQYLLKPLRREELERALRTDLRLRHRPQAVTVRAGGRTAVLHLPNIRYVESRDHGSLFFLAHGEQFFQMSLTQAEKLLPRDRFSRCHNSYLVNLEQIQEAGGRELLLLDGTRLPIGRRYAEGFQLQFVRYLNLSSR